MRSATSPGLYRESRACRRAPPCSSTSRISIRNRSPARKTAKQDLGISGDVHAWRRSKIHDLRRLYSRGHDRHAGIDRARYQRSSRKNCPVVILSFLPDAASRSTEDHQDPAHEERYGRSRSQQNTTSSTPAPRIRSCRRKHGSRSIATPGRAITATSMSKAIMRRAAAHRPEQDQGDRRHHACFPARRGSRAMCIRCNSASCAARSGRSGATACRSSIR